jgi:protein SCO1/2
VGRLLQTASLLGMLMGACAPALAQNEPSPPPQRKSPALEGWPIEPFGLVDHHGRKLTESGLRGRWTFVLFGDTRCGAPCTSALTALSGLSKRIERSDAILTTQVVFVSLDPAHDNRARLRQFLAPYEKEFIGATGSRQTLKRLADEMGAAADFSAQQASTAASRPGYRGTLVLIGPDGLIRAEYLPPFDVKRLTADFLKTRARR